MSEGEQGFVLPDWTAPLDADQQIARAPADGKAKGLYFLNLLEQLDALGPPAEDRPTYLPFIDYPLRDYMALLASTAARLHPDETLRGALRRVGRTVYPKLASTLIGKALFFRAGRDVGVFLDEASRAYAVSVSPGTVELTERSGHRARVELREIWSFPEAHQVGIFEGAFLAVGVEGEVRIRVLSPCDVDFEVSWSP